MALQKGPHFPRMTTRLHDRVRRALVEGGARAAAHPLLRAGFNALTAFMPGSKPRLRKWLARNRVADPAKVAGPGAAHALALRRADWVLGSARCGAEEITSTHGRPSLAYVTPLSDREESLGCFERMLIRTLARSYSLTIVTEEDAVADNGPDIDIARRDADWFRAHAAGFERILYRVPPSAASSFILPLLADIPGIVILDDLFLGAVLAGRPAEEAKLDMARAVYESHGYHVLRNCLDAADPLAAMADNPASFPILFQAQGIIALGDQIARQRAEFYPAHSGANWQVVHLGIGREGAAFAAECVPPAIETLAGAGEPVHDIRVLRGLAVESRETPGSSQDRARAMAQRLVSRSRMERPARQFLIDVTALAELDRRTGIQRVVRAQVQALLVAPPPGYRVEPVKLEDGPDGLRYAYARRYGAALIGADPDTLADAVVEVGAGDVFYGADLLPVGAVEAERAGLYRRWRESGVLVAFAVYDLLPIAMPQHFPPGTAEHHASWLAAVGRSADCLICISRTVAGETRNWFADRRIEVGPILNSPLGADIVASAPTRGVPEGAGEFLGRLAASDTFLMVGTVEPRKGHLFTLAAFEELWSKGSDAILVIVGAEAWRQMPSRGRRNLPEIVRRLRNHPERSKRLFWLEEASDEHLMRLYEACGCLIAASEGEGYGLPLVEAARHGLPVLARDIPVFREVGGSGTTFFSGDDPAHLARAVEDWIVHRRRAAAPDPEASLGPTWAENAECVKALLLAQLPERCWVSSCQPRPSPSRRP